MNTRVPAATTLACLGMAAPAGAHHVPCSWGAQLDADASRPHHLEARVQAPNWCPYGGVGVNAAAAGHSAHAHLGPDGLVWVVDPPPERAGAPAQQAAATPPPTLRLSISPRRVTAGRAVRFRLRARWSDGLPGAALPIRFAGRRLRTDAYGRASLRVRLRPGVARARAGRGLAVATVRVRTRA